MEIPADFWQLVDFPLPCWIAEGRVEGGPLKDIFLSAGYQGDWPWIVNCGS